MEISLLLPNAEGLSADKNTAHFAYNHNYSCAGSSNQLQSHKISCSIAVTYRKCLYIKNLDFEKSLSCSRNPNAYFLDPWGN